MLSPAIQNLIEALCALPGVGPRTAQRMAFYLLQHNREKATRLSGALYEAAKHIVHCERCRTLCDTPICPLCRHPKRDASLLCVVEHPIDMLALEKTGSYKGLYFVLMGKLSPLDGIGPQEIGMDHLLKRLQEEPIEEVILATNPTVEGDTTAHYIAEKCKTISIPCSRMARGVPLGGELEYLDGRTLTRAFMDRSRIEDIAE